MKHLVEATWGLNERDVVTTVEQLDALLDRVAAEAGAGRPQLVELTRRDGAGTLGVVVGADRSLLNYVPATTTRPI